MSDRVRFRVVCFIHLNTPYLLPSLLIISYPVIHYKESDQPSSFFSSTANIIFLLNTQTSSFSSTANIIFLLTAAIISSSHRQLCRPPSTSQ
ncbi:hypothetical protein HanIR_Chr15g0730761 [Helianthus annuus]|nr:hypothetical protein HanIR_Chr15g0730761 [Helianthus annuus]